MTAGMARGRRGRRIRSPAPTTEGSGTIQQYAPQLDQQFPAHFERHCETRNAANSVEDRNAVRVYWNILSADGNAGQYKCILELINVSSTAISPALPTARRARNSILLCGGVGGPGHVLEQPGKDHRGENRSKTFGQNERRDVHGPDPRKRV